MPVIRVSPEAYKKILGKAAIDGMSMEAGLDRLLAELELRAEQGVKDDRAKAEREDGSRREEASKPRKRSPKPRGGSRKPEKDCGIVDAAIGSFDKWFHADC